MSSATQVGVRQRAHTHTHIQIKNMNRSFMNNGLGVISLADTCSSCIFNSLLLGCIVSSMLGALGVYALSADENILTAFVHWFSISMTALVFDSSGNFHRYIIEKS